MFTALKNLKQFTQNPLLFVEKTHKEYGDFCSVYLGPKKFYFIYHPDLAEEVLLTQMDCFQKSRLIFDKIRPITGRRGLVQLEGQHWNEMRKITGELFKPQALNQYPAIFNHYLTDIINRLDDYAQCDGTIDFAELMISYTIKTMGQIVFGNKQDERVEKIANEFIKLNHLCGLRMRSIVTVPDWIPSKMNNEIKQIRQRIIHIIQTLLQTQSHLNSNNLLSLLNKELGKTSSLELIQDQLMTFLFAGYETTAASMAFCFYLVASNRTCQETIRKEAQQLNLSNNPTVTELRSLNYTFAVYREALRLFPPAWILAREVVKDTSLMNQTLKRGDNIIICIKEMHRHHAFWQQPNVFIPERFLDKQQSAEQHKFKFIPFGMGPRICSGTQVAMLEAVNALARLCQRYEFTLADNFHSEIEAMVTLHPKNGILLKVKKL